MLLAISSTADSERGPRYAEQAFSAIHRANTERRPISLLFGRHADTTSLYFRTPTPLLHVVETQLAAAYPDGTIQRVQEDALDAPPGARVWSADLRLRPDLFPMRRHPQFEDSLNRNVSDPLAGILATLSGDQQESLKSVIEITVQPASAWRTWHAQRAIERLISPFFRAHHTCARLYTWGLCSRFCAVRVLSVFCGVFARKPHVAPRSDELSLSATRQHEREEDLQAASDKLRRPLFAARIRLNVFAALGMEKQARAKLSEMAGAFGQFTCGIASFRLSRIRERTASRLIPRTFLVSAEELATLWHPATGTVRALAMEKTDSRQLEPPVVIPSTKAEQDVAELGRLKFRRRRDCFGIRLDDRRRHLAIIGKTGMGKSTLLHNLIASDILSGRGVALIDPHGDLADAILRVIPSNRTNDVVLFDAGDRDFPLSFNPLCCRRQEQVPLVTAGVVSCFKKLYGDSWGPRLEYILRNAVQTLVLEQRASLASLQRLLSDAAYRKQVTGRLSDPVLRAFWQNEFARWNDRYRNEAVAPIQNKVGQFLTHPILRAIIGQVRSTLDCRQVMDDGGILIVNLSKGRIGEDASTLLGSLLVTQLQLSAMSRADIPEQTRRDFFAYVDEFQNFATESFATILSEARKYRLSLTLANQYLDQMDVETLHAVFGNVGSLLAFQVGARDADVLTEQFGEQHLTPHDLMNLPRFTAVVRLLINGMPSRPFTMETLPPAVFRSDTHRPAIIRRVSRHRYARPAETVENELERTLAHVYASSHS